MILVVVEVGALFSSLCHPWQGAEEVVLTLMVEVAKELIPGLAVVHHFPSYSWEGVVGELVMGVSKMVGEEPYLEVEVEDHLLREEGVGVLLLTEVAVKVEACQH